MTHLHFGNYFCDITVCDQKLDMIDMEQKGNVQLSKRQLEWNWMTTNAHTRGMKYVGDSLCDDALDGLWDIENGTILHEENPEMLRVILIRCHHMIQEDEESLIIDYNNPQDITYLSYHDERIKLFLDHLFAIPTWVDANLLSKGSSILLSRIFWLFTTYLDFTIPEIMASLEGTSTFASLAFLYNIISKEMDQSNSTKDQGNNENTNRAANEKDHSLDLSISDKVLESGVKRILNLIFRSFVAAFSKCLKPSTDIWNDLLEFRIEMAVLRRKILSIFGVVRWDEKKLGMPFNQQFLGYCLGLFALHSINLLKSLQFGTIVEDDLNSILHTW